MAVETDFPEFLRFVQQLPELVIDNGLQPMRTAMQATRDDFPDDPPPKPRDHIAWDSAAQRRWYFWAVQNGILDNPYQRTGALHESLTPFAERVSAAQIEGGLLVEQKYGLFVLGSNVDPKEKAAVHQGRWWEFDEEFEQRGEFMTTLFFDNLWETLAPLWENAT